MTDDDATSVARVRGLLTEVGDVVGGDADSVVVRVGRTRASIRAVDIAENLEVLSVTQLIAVNLPTPRNYATTSKPTTRSSVSAVCDAATRRA